MIEPHRYRSLARRLLSAPAFQDRRQSADGKGFRCNIWKQTRNPKTPTGVFFLLTRLSSSLVFQRLAPNLLFFSSKPAPSAFLLLPTLLPIPQ